ncbi:MAG: YbhB/YbcL family Raf kinase inhibitor-like protein [Haloferacaceae archaeon]
MSGRTARRSVLVALAAGLAGCSGLGGLGDSGSSPTPAPDNPAVGDVEAQGTLRLTSPAFDDGGPIPEAYGRDAENVNPPLSIAGVPAGAATLTLIVDDPDAVEPAGQVWLHWLVWNVPASRTEIPEGWEPESAVEGRNDFGRRGYGGPDPPDGRHTYRFKLYALDATLDLPASASKTEVGAAMEGSILAATQLTGTYAP